MRTTAPIATAMNTGARPGTGRPGRLPRVAVVAASLMIALGATLSSEPVCAQAVQAGPAPTPAGTPPDWERTKEQLRELTFAGEDAKAIAIAEKVVATYPRFADGHARLGGAHESAARALARTNPPLARRGFETAATHLRRAFELGGGEYPDATIRGLIDLYEYALPSPETWKATVLEALERYPQVPSAQWYGVQLLLREGRSAELGGAFRRARAALPAAAAPRLEYASLLVSLARDQTAPAVQTALVREALGLADEAVKKNPGDRSARRAADAIREDVVRLQQTRPPSSPR